MPPIEIASTPVSPKPQRRLGERLIEAGYLSQSQLDLALREQKRRGGLIGQILVSLGFVPQEIISGFVAKEAEIKVVSVNRCVIDKAVLQLVPFETAKRLKALPLSRENGSLTVALADPLDVVAIDTLQQLTGLEVEVVSAPERDILNSLELHYGTGDSIELSIEQAMDEQGGEGPKTAAAKRAEAEAAEAGVDAPIIRLVDQIIARAVSLKASDIHFEPEEKTLRVRMRIDGVLYQDLLVPKSMQSPVIARLKIMAELCEGAARAGGFRPGQHALHLSGSLGLDVLEPATAVGAEILSLHPLQTFPDVERGIERLPGSPIRWLSMIWFCGDSAERILYETRRDEAGGGFELRLIYSNGRRTVERIRAVRDRGPGGGKRRSNGPPGRLRLFGSPDTTSGLCCK